MCGILGFIASADSRFEQKTVSALLERLLTISERRGKDASGVAFVNDSDIFILKRPISAKALIKSDEYDEWSRQIQNTRPPASRPFVVMGHTRMVTNGSEELHENNQPVIKGGAICFHNGIVVNDNELWSLFPGMNREYEVDTEAILGLVAHARAKSQTFVDAVRFAFQRIKGANSAALLADDADALLLATTNGSLYYAKSQSGQEAIYASERYILESIKKHRSIAPLFRDSAIAQLKPGSGCAISIATLCIQHFLIDSCAPSTSESGSRRPRRAIHDARPPATKKTATLLPAHISKNLAEMEKLLSIDSRSIQGLKRCSACVLPETFPFILYDANGVCNYCRKYRPVMPRGSDALLELVRPIRRGGGEPDCLVPLSGGRDSSYGIHYIKRVLGMNPIAFTYDWGMVTDIARRNTSRMCGQLGVEHILISADIRRKRRNIGMNVAAWLKNPDLGTVPLFMAGDKQFFYYASSLKRQMNLGLVIFSMNPLERTDFKVAFCGINEDFSKSQHYGLTFANKMRLAFYYGNKFMRNPAFLNSSLCDSLLGYLSYYFVKNDYVSLYDYIAWDRNEIVETLTGEYDWERARDTKSTWRIGDGTAAFYNYIYLRIAGFTENDTFRSNQIRSGMIGREKALALVAEDNQPRIESIKWYCDAIGLDCSEVIKRINSIPTLYE